MYVIKEAYSIDGNNSVSECYSSTIRDNELQVVLPPVKTQNCVVDCCVIAIAYAF
jgi:hypothetical protein